MNFFTFLKPIADFFGSQLFGNLILLVSAILAFGIGVRQIALNDVVELYAITRPKETVNVDDGSRSSFFVVSIQNVGTRLVYFDKYIFNGIVYQTNGQILPPTYSQCNAGYWIDLPNNGQHHVSIELYYHDLDSRYWKSEVVSDFIDNAWKTSSLKRTEQ